MLSGRGLRRTVALVPLGLAVHTAQLGTADDPAGRQEYLRSYKRAAHTIDLGAVRREVVAQCSGASARASWLRGEMSSNHAGETGAAYIYEGAQRALEIRRALRQLGLPLSEEGVPECTAFCKEHQEAELLHLAFMEELLSSDMRTKLVPLWRLAGFYLGMVPTLVLGPGGLYATVEPVETFVVDHYSSQYLPLEQDYSCPALCRLLRLCCADEAHHRDDAARRLGVGEPSMLRQAWFKMVVLGSSGAASVARVI